MTAVLEGTTGAVVHLDNVTGVLRSSTVAALLTSEKCGGARRVGASEMFSRANDRPWLVTGNNLQANGGDVCRVQVDPAGFPVDAKVVIQKQGGPKEIRTEFYVRVANGTKALDAVEREKYVLGRWSKQ